MKKYQKHKNIENINWGEGRLEKAPSYPNPNKAPSYPNPNTPETRTIQIVNLSYYYLHL